jgi:hypothetical protein
MVTVDEDNDDDDDNVIPQEAMGQLTSAKWMPPAPEPEVEHKDPPGESADEDDDE